MGTLKDEKGVLEFENTLRHRRRWDDLFGEILGRLRSGRALVAVVQKLEGRQLPQ